MHINFLKKHFSVYLLPVLISTALGVIGVGALLRFSNTSIQTNPFTFGNPPWFWFAAIILIANFLAAWLVQKRVNLKLSDLTKHFDALAVGTAEVTFNLGQLQQQVTEQAQLSDSSAATIHEISASTSQLSSTSHASVLAVAATGEIVKQGRHYLSIISQQILDANEEAHVEQQASSNSVDMILATTKKIEGIVGVVGEVAFQTNLLAINAAIQASHGGQQGKAFGVIAAEIRKLSGQSTQAANDIKGVLQDIKLGTNDSARIVKSLIDKMQGIIASTNEIDKVLTDIGKTVTTTEAHTLEMAESLTEHVHTADEVSRIIMSVKDSLVHVSDQSQRTAEQSAQLTHVSESLHVAFSHFGVQNKRHAHIHAIAEQQAKVLQQLFEHAIAQKQLSQEQVFDQAYQKIPQTNPPQYHTQYDAFTDSVLPAYQEAILQNNPGVVFVIATDMNGYVPTHNNRFSHGQTGDYAIDLLHSRSKRIFSDTVGVRCGSHNERFLLQTYKRDTGELMHDLSVPVYVLGKRWGGVRVGYLAQTIIDA